MMNLSDGGVFPAWRCRWRLESWLRSGTDCHVPVPEQLMDKHEIEIGGVTYQSQPAPDGYCFGCAFYVLPNSEGCSPANEMQSCVSHNRFDRTAVIWVQK